MEVGKGPRMITKAERKIILTEYGFKAGKFDSGDDAVYKLSFRDRRNFGKIEKSRSVDTFAEYLTAKYFSPIKIDRTSEAKIRMILPHNKEGALKLCAMWLQKRATNALDIVTNASNVVDYSKNYLKVIDKIKAKSGITDAEIYNYYAKAMSKEIMKLGRKHMGTMYQEVVLKQSVLKPLIEYYKNPNRNNFNDIVRVMYYFLGLYINRRSRNGNVHKDIFGKENAALRKILDALIPGFGHTVHRFANKQLHDNKLKPWKPDMTVSLK